jgi:hypothetical protein
MPVHYCHNIFVPINTYLSYIFLYVCHQYEQKILAWPRFGALAFSDKG